LCCKLWKFLLYYAFYNPSSNTKASKFNFIMPFLYIRRHKQNMIAFHLWRLFCLGWNPTCLSSSICFVLLFFHFHFFMFFRMICMGTSKALFVLVEKDLVTSPLSWMQLLAYHQENLLTMRQVRLVGLEFFLGSHIFEPDLAFLLFNFLRNFTYIPIIFSF